MLRYFVDIGEGSLPPGFRFKPTEQEILKYFVRPAIETGFLRSPITCCDLYTSEPWNLFDKRAVDCFWIYTPLKKLKNENKEISMSIATQKKKRKTKTKENIERTARCGSWKEKTLKDIKDCAGKLLGHGRYYLYDPKEGLGLGFDDGDKDHDDLWFMHEYTLPKDEGLNFGAICKVEYKPNSGKKPPNNININNSALVASDTHKPKADSCGDDDHEQGPIPKKPRLEDATASGAFSINDDFASLDDDDEFLENLCTVLTDSDETQILECLPD
ncbi:No apical meristem (NAM) protein [Corchorus capsularis]|uniref:No apical meristem (NAM) protein n=1 Tax=Corchorus capsularis TaxID=210143 RepID=A0A1R3GTN1_COCAP|nr:No apical meristem (NAM) protein [Corchorus capsularis]